MTNGPSTLAYEPNTRTFLFTYAMTGMVTELVAFDESGAFLWKVRGTEICNGEIARLHALAGGGHFAVGLDNYTCSGTGDRHAEVRIYSPDGTELAKKQLAQPAISGAYACNTDCSNVFGYYSDYAATPHGAWLDVGTNTVRPPVTLGGILYGGVEFTAAAFDGTHHFVLSANHERNGVWATFQFFDTATGGWVGNRTVSATRKGLPGEMVWTGSGFVAAAPTFPVSENAAFPTDYTQISIQLWSLAADGTVLQSIPLEAHAGFHPKLAWAHDRVAVTWVRIPPASNQPFQRYLSFLQCAP